MNDMLKASKINAPLSLFPLRIRLQFVESPKSLVRGYLLLFFQLQNLLHDV